MTQAQRRPRLGIEALEERAVPAAASIGGSVYWDQNNTGLREGGEVGIGATTVSLLDSSGATVGTTTTDSAGYYRFSIDPRISTAPTTTEVDAVFASTPTNVKQTQSLAQFDPSLGTLTGVQITVTGDLVNHSVVENTGPNATHATVEVNGTIAVQGPSGVSMTGTPTGQLDADLPTFDGNGDLQGASSKDFGQQTYSSTLGTLSLSAASDLAPFIGTGSVNFSENATANVCTCSSGNLLSMIRTSADAKVKVVYQYTPSNALKPGQYTVVEQQPGGYLDGYDTGDNVHVITGSNKTDTITVTLNGNDSLNNNFGELKPSSLSGHVYVDNQHTGTFVAGDQPLGGVTVTLNGTDDSGTAVSLQTSTDANGGYSFGSLNSGYYTITEMQPANYLPGPVNIGTQGGTPGQNSVALHLAQGLAGTDYNFANEVTSQPHDTTTPTPTPTPTPMPSTPTPAPAPDTGTEAPSKFFFIGSDWGGWGW